MMNGRATRRTPQRSIILPTNGVAIAPSACEMVMAKATVPRRHPKSATMGFKKTPKVKRVTGPLPTIRAKVEPKTTHQGFLKSREAVISESIYHSGAPAKYFPATLAKKVPEGGQAIPVTCLFFQSRLAFAERMLLPSGPRARRSETKWRTAWGSRISCG